ncbi:hypothetical protein ACQZV8_10420 [Magnetococcales bacterium HHB-1]
MMPPSDDQRKLSFFNRDLSKSAQSYGQQFIERAWPEKDIPLLIEKITKTIAEIETISPRTLKVCWSKVLPHLQTVISETVALVERPVSWSYWESGCLESRVQTFAEEDLSSLDLWITFSYPFEEDDFLREKGFTGIVLNPFLDQDYRSHAQQRFNFKLQKFIDKIEHSIQKKKEVVLFISINRGNFPSIDFIAQSLQETGRIDGFCVALITPASTRVYRDGLSCVGSLSAFALLIQKLPATVKIYLQAHARWSFLGQFIKAYRKELHLVHEVYDWMEAFIGDQAVFQSQGVFQPEEMALMIESEAVIRNHSAGWIYKDGGSWLQERVRESRAPSLQVLPCSPKSWMIPPNVKQKIMKDQPISLVYAGQVQANRMPDRVFGDMNYLPVVRDLTAQNFLVTIYQALFHSRSSPESDFADYRAEDKRNGRFSFKKGVPLPDLLPRLNQQFHFGLMIYYFEENIAVGQRHLQGSVASKLFTYISSGIPVLISDTFTYMAHLVETYQLGVVVSKEEVLDLEKKLRGVDYPQVQTQVKAAQEIFNMDRSVGDIKKMLAIDL